MSKAKNALHCVLHIVQRFRSMGARMLTGCCAALVCAVLIFSSPEVGLFGMGAGVVSGMISVVLIRPQMNTNAKATAKARI